MQPIHILVRDSYHTAAIAQRLRQYYGDKAVCHESFVPAGIKIDVFVLSGRDILCGPEKFVPSLKSQHGSEKCKAVAVSTMEEYLREIAGDKDLGVDFTFHKGYLVEDIIASKEDEAKVQKFIDELLSAVS